VGTKEPVTRQLDKVSRKDGWEMAAEKGQLEKDSWERTAGNGQLGDES
jgi:hypothetical protein